LRKTARPVNRNNSKLCEAQAYAPPSLGRAADTRRALPVLTNLCCLPFSHVVTSLRPPWPLADRRFPPSITTPSAVAEKSNGSHPRVAPTSATSRPPNWSPRLFIRRPKLCRLRRFKGSGTLGFAAQLLLFKCTGSSAATFPPSSRI